MIEHVVGTAFYQASFPELDRALQVVGWSVVGFVVVFVAYVLVLGRRGGLGGRIRVVVGAVGGVALIVLGLLAAVLAVALLATPLYLAVVVVVLTCLAVAAWLCWRRPPR